MKSLLQMNFRVAAIALSITALVILTEPARAADSEGWTLYQAFVEECETATSMKSLLPFLPKWRHKRFDKSDETSRQETLHRLCKETRDDYQDITFVSEETSGKKETILHLKATWQDSPMKGKITLVREGDELKVESWFWATGGYS